MLLHRYNLGNNQCLLIYSYDFEATYGIQLIFPILRSQSAKQQDLHLVIHELQFL